MNCPGSVKAEEGFPDTTSKYAERGTVLHDIAEHCLGTGSDGSEFIDKNHVVFDENGEPYAEALVNADDIETLHVYIDYVRNLGGETLIETRVDFSRWVPEGFGTADAIVFKGQTMYVIDLKTGQGNRVHAEENSQCMLYGLGAWSMFDMIHDFDQVVHVIVQPWLDHIDEWEQPVGDLLHWGDTHVAPAANLALSDDPPRNPSQSACLWCKAKGHCRAYAEHALEVVADDFKDILEPFDPKDPNVLGSDEIAAVLPQLGLVEDFVKTMKETATNIIETGGEIPGYKLVEGRSIRKWEDEEKAETAIRKRLKVADAYKKTLITPAQAEKKLGKGHPLIQDLTIKPKGKPTLAPVTDKRPALEFNTVEDDFDGFESDAA